VALLVFPALAVLPLAGAQTVTVIQPHTPGLQLIGSQSPDFAAAAAAIVSAQTLQQIATYLPLAAVFKNASTQPLMAYTIRWTVDNKSTVDKNLNPLVGIGGGASSPRNPENYLQPGAAVLVVPDMLFDKEPGLARLQAMLQQESRMRPDWDTAKALTISLDSAIFASGQFVGPDTANLFAGQAAYSTAWRAVETKVEAQVTSGVPFVTIAAALQQVTDQPSSGGKQATVDWIARAQAAEARQLIRLYDNHGAQAVIDFIKRQLATPEIVVHR
jgi:hypothetical protein